MEKPNRAERRRNKFGGGRATAQGGWPTVQPNPVFHPEAEPGETEPASPTPDDNQATAAPDTTAEADPSPG
jgi:hypothetical protein